MSNIPISVLKKSLDNKLGKETWKDFEAETLLLVTELPFSSLLLDKLNVVKVIENDPSLFFEDPMFMIYATAVINNELANFEYLPHITSLELAFSLVEIARVLGVETYELPEFSLANKEYIRHILIEEGYSEVVPPFDVVGIGSLPEGQTGQDTMDKKKAIEEYIHASYC